MNFEELEFSKKGAAQNELRARTRNRGSDTSVHVKFFAPVAEIAFGFSDWVSEWRVGANLAAK